MGITIQSNSTLTVIIHLITLEASWFNVFWFTSSVLDFGLLLLLYSSCVFHHYQQRSTVRIALPCTPRTCLLHLNSPLPTTILKGWTYPRVCPKGTVTEKTEPCINWWTAILLLINNQNWFHHYQQHSHILHFRVIINLIRTIMHCFCNHAP